MRSLSIVVLDEGSGRIGSLLQVCGPIDGEAFFLIGAIVAFDKGVLLRMMRSTDLDLDAQTGAKAHQSRRKITALWTADPACITIERDERGSTVLGQRARQGF